MPNTSPDPAGPVTLVTGGAGNLGRAVTRAFLEAGHRVFVPLHRGDAQGVLDELQREFPGRLDACYLDLTTERGAAAAVKQALEWTGRVDAVAHLVGGWSGGALLADTPTDLWDRMMDLNVRSAYLVARAALPEMLEDGGGTLVFVSSRAAREGRARNAAYAVSKSALVTLTEAIAEEYAGAGIRAYAVLPDTLDTPANREAMPDADPSSWTPPEAVAAQIVHLCSGAASLPNGAALPVYGPSAAITVPAL
jgi:NAD(P)-dependent dehydrogenase (short-subunit alcohol dehydrogenase family)